MHTKNRIVLKLVLWLLPIVLFFKDLHAQSYIADVRKLSVEHGLSNRFITSICKDSRGFIWIATQYGLNRYDGYEFKCYTKENSALTTNNVERIYEDTQQQLWIIHRTTSGRIIDILDLQTNRIQNFNTLFKTLAPFKTEMINDMYIDREKTPWITTVSGKLYRYKNQRFKHIATVPISEQDRITIYHASKGFVWTAHEIRSAGTFKRLTGIDLKADTVKTFDITPGLLPTGMDQDHNLWLLQPKDTTFLKLRWEKQAVEPATVLPPELPDFASSVTFTKQHYLDPPGDFLWWIPSPYGNRKDFPTAWHLRGKPPL